MEGRGRVVRLQSSLQFGKASLLTWRVPVRSTCVVLACSNEEVQVHTVLATCAIMAHMKAGNAHATPSASKTAVHGKHYQPVVVWSHGRSGSTLLLDLLSSDPEVWSIYEPLQEVRERSPHVGPGEGGLCRDRFSSTLSSTCPLRDAALLLSMLQCNLLPLLTAWYGELELAGRRGAFLPHPTAPGSGWVTTSYTPDLSDTRASLILEHQRKCRTHPLRVAKTIRLNGHLASVFNVTHALGRPSPLILHLVRDPRAVYYSRKRLSEPFGLPPASETQEKRTLALRKWARTTCEATRRDAEQGRRNARNYLMVNYSTFVRHPQLLVERLYARHFLRAVPPEVQRFIAKHFSPAVPREASHSDTKSEAWQYEYGTQARDVEHVDRRWEKELSRWEVDAIDEGCASAARHGRNELRTNGAATRKVASSTGMKRSSSGKSINASYRRVYP